MLQEKQRIIIATKQISPATRTGWLQPSSTYKNLRGTLITKLPTAASWNSGIPKWIGLWYRFSFRNLELSVWSRDCSFPAAKMATNSRQTLNLVYQWYVLPPNGKCLLPGPPLLQENSLTKYCFTSSSCILRLALYIISYPHLHFTAWNALYLHSPSFDCFFEHVIPLRIHKSLKTKNTLTLKLT